jgi:hypothetical protein
MLNWVGSNLSQSLWLSVGLERWVQRKVSQFLTQAGLSQLMRGEWLGGKRNGDMKSVAQKLWNEPAAFLGLVATLILLVLNILGDSDWSLEQVVNILAPLVTGLGIRQLVVPTTKASKGIAPARDETTYQRLEPRWVLFALAETTLFGLAAAFSSVVGVILAVASHRSGRKAAKRQAEQEVHEQLMAARREAEQLSAELHDLKMERDRDQRSS